MSGRPAYLGERALIEGFVSHARLSPKTWCLAEQADLLEAEIVRTVEAALEQTIERSPIVLRYIGALSLLCECAVYLDHAPEMRESIELALEDACAHDPRLSWRRILNRFELNVAPPPPRATDEAARGAANPAPRGGDREPPGGYTPLPSATDPKPPQGGTGTVAHRGRAADAATPEVEP